MLFRSQPSFRGALRYVASLARSIAIIKSLKSFRAMNFKAFSISAASRRLSTVKESAAPQRDQRDINAPIKYVGSTAAAWTSKEGRSGTIPKSDTPWFQPYAVVGSVAVFLIYFCVLREENDVDLELEKSLYDRVPGLEQTQLIINYKYNLENNGDNAEIVARMKEMGMQPEDIKS